MPTIAEGTLVGRYRIRTRLGQGGMGEVFLADDTSELERTVALKFLTGEIASNPSLMQRFIQEARTVSTLNHPNIVTIYEFGQADDIRFIATEFIDGTTLREHLRHRRVKLHHVLDIAIQVAAALDAAHEVGVVHRDIKPDNIMIRKRDQIVKVLDFGLAKRTAKEAPVTLDLDADTKTHLRTDPGTVMGTVAYMSPEQSRGADVDARTDIWSFGVVLYEMLAGSVPFTASDIHRQIIAIQEQEPRPISTFAEGVPERLQEILGKTMAKEPGDRYQTMKDLLIDLRNLRRKLDVEAEIERLAPPELRAAASGADRASARLTTPRAASDPSSGAMYPRPSSAEYIIDRIRSHKRGLLVAATVLLLTAIGVGWLYVREPPASSQIESIAVLPFQNMSRNPDAEYLSEGMTESLINTLAPVAGLSVKARSSVIRYKDKEVDPTQVGSDLSVQSVLTGRLTQRNEDLVLSLALVDARNGNQLWGQQYSRKLNELVSLQSEIAADVLHQLRPNMTNPQQRQASSGGTDDAAAYQAYLKGRYYWNKGVGPGFEKSREFFQQAIEIDPSYALAYAGLSDYFGVSVAFGAFAPTKENWLRSEAAANKALALNPRLGEAYNGLAGVKLYDHRDWPAAERDFRRGIALVPNNAVIHQHYAHSLLLAERYEDAVAEMQRALQLEPLELRFNLNFGRIFFFRRQFDRAIEQFRKTLEIDPNYAAAHEWLGNAYEQKGMQREAISEWSTALTLSGDGDQAAALQRAYETSGFEPALRALAQIKLEELQERTGEGRYVPAVHFVTAYMGLGDKEQAFGWLEKAVDERNRFALEFRANPLYDSLRSDPRYAAIVSRVALKME